MRATVIAFAVISTLPFTVTAQGTSETALVFAQVEVLAVPLQVDVTGVTNFGSVFNFAHEEYIDPKIPEVNQTTAAIVITTSPSTLLLVNLGQCPKVLASPEGASLQFYSQFAMSSSSDVQSDANNVLLECASSFQVTPEASPANGDPTLRSMYMWMGGRVVIAAGQEPGAYSGVIEIAVEVL